MQGSPTYRQTMVNDTVNDISYRVSCMKDLWGLKKVELGLMENGADQEIQFSDRSLESQDAGDLVPYELLSPSLRLGTGEVLPGWYARGAPKQGN